MIRHWPVLVLGHYVPCPVYQRLREVICTIDHQNLHMTLTAFSNHVWQSCVNSNSLSQWQMANFGPLHNPSSSTNCETNSQLILHSAIRFLFNKYLIDWLIMSARRTTIANVGANPSMRGVLSKWVKYNSIFIYIHIAFFLHQFWCVINQKMWNHARMCLSGVRTIKIDYYPQFRPINVDFKRKTVPTNISAKIT